MTKERCRRTAIILVSLLLIPSMVSAQTGKRFSVTFKNEKLATALKTISKKSGVNVTFAYEDVEKYNVTKALNNVDANEAVKTVLDGKPLTYNFQNGRITVFRAELAKMAENMFIAEGVVVDTGGQPLPGVSVKSGDGQTICLTDVDGKFRLMISKGKLAQLMFSYIGMESQTVTLSSKNSGKIMRIVMQEEASKLGEVVVTGIFRKAKDSYTGALTTIDSEQLQTFKGSNLLQTLKNIDASINFPVNNLAGSNPNVLPNMNIRGSSSLPMSVEEFNTNAQQTVNTPLIILDGFEISLTKLMDYNDEQIERINILKDAAATAIYGSRGANGVIVVVTKTPKEGKLRVTAKAGIDLQVPDLSSYDLLNAAEKLQLEKQVGLYTDEYEPINQWKYNNLYSRRLKAVLDGTDIDWIHKPVRTGVGQRYNIQLDGGANEFRWATSLGYNDIEGAMKGSSRKTVNGDITLMYSVKNLIFRNYTSFTSNKSKESEYGSFQDYVDQQPYNNPYDENGNVVKTFSNFFGTDEVGNPLYDATLNTFNKNEYINFLDNFSVEWMIIDGLRFRGKIGYQTTRSTSDLFLPAEHSTFASSSYNTTEGLLRKGRYTYGTGRTDLFSANATLSYNKTFAKKHQIYAGLDWSLSEENYTNYTFVAEGFTNEDMSFLGNATQYEHASAPTGSKDITRLVGVTGNVNYTFDNRYYVDLSYRIDGSSKFGSNDRFAPFWSVGLGWNMHNEKWLKAIEPINTLRLRSSYGITGSQDITTESINTSYNYVSGSRYLGWTSASMMGLGNPDLTWQKTNELNIGIEFGLFNNRITGEFDYYTKKTTDLLSAMDLPLSVGFASYVANIGEMSNHGFEASVNAYIIRDYKRKFNWMVGAQLVYDKNKITRLSDAIKAQNDKYLEQNVEVSNLFYEGYPLNSIYAVQSLGIDPSTGKEIFLDREGNVTSTWNAADKVFLGSSQPLYRGNFRTMVMWNNFTLNVSFGYHWGGKMYNSTLRDRVEVSTERIAKTNVDKRVLSDRWMNPGDNTFFRGFTYNDTRATSRYVFDDRMLTLQSVSLQYRWNNDWLQRNSGLESILFAMNINDLFYWSSVKYERGTNYPYARNIQGSVTFTF